MNHEISRVCIVGAGFMGTQIALQSAAHGYAVSMHDIADESLGRSEGEFTSFLDRMIADGCAAAGQRQDILDRVTRTSSLAQAVSDADLVIEAAREEIEVKRCIFTQLDELAPERAILGTNSSSRPSGSIRSSN